MEQDNQNKETNINPLVHKYVAGIDPISGVDSDKLPAIIEYDDLNGAWKYHIKRNEQQTTI